MIKAIFLDVDGTLMSHTIGAVPDSAVDALNAAREKGVKIFLATGRSFRELERLPLWDCTFDGYVTLNGLCCLNQEQELVFEQPMAQKDVEVAARLFRDKQVPMLFVERDREYVNFVNDVVRQTQKAISSPVPNVGEYEGGNLFQIVLYADAEERRRVGELLTGSRVLSWNNYAADVLPVDGDKIFGIKKMAEIYELSMDELMAFGDAENDIDMLKSVGVGVAMGNGFALAKQAADYVTDSVDQDGVKNALEHFGVI